MREIISIFWGVCYYFIVSGAIILLMQLVGVKFADAAQASIPRAAYKYRPMLVSAAHREFGIDAPVSLLAAQVHQESAWNPRAVSPVGARGLTQFMPKTAAWLPSIAPHVGAADPHNPAWSLPAMCAYNKHNLAQIRGAASACDHWAFALSAYNGGLGWVHRDRKKADKLDYDARRYWGHVEHVNSGRGKAFFAENRGYPKRIFALQSLYVAAGWGPGVHCD